MLSTESRDQNFFVMAIEKTRTIVNAFWEIQTAWGFIAAAFLAVAFLYAIFSFQKRVNKGTSSQIHFFVKIKKDQKIWARTLHRVKPKYGVFTILCIFS